MTLIDSLTAYKTRIIKTVTVKSTFSFRCGFVISETLPESDEMDSYQLHAHNRDHFPTLWVPLMDCRYKAPVR